MKQKQTEFKTSLLSIAVASEDHFHNPSLRYVQFVFCDDKPNENKQGVEYEDFKEIAQSSIGTPIKMRFLGEAAGAHIGSIPIGHITHMSENELEDGTHQLIADGVLYASEYPDEIEFIETAFAENRAPGISFEMHYDQSLSKIKEGVEWLKGVFTRAATFVRNPAYGTRTALLALASNASLNDEDMAEGLTAIANELRPRNTNKGGNNKVEEDLKKANEALEALRKELEAATAQVTELQTANASLTTANSELQTKVTASETALAEITREKLIATRTAAVADTGLALETDEAKLAKKQEIWASMEEETFAAYVDDLKAAIKVPTVKTSFASLRTASASRTITPRLQVELEDNSLAGLRERLGSISRASISEEE